MIDKIPQSQNIPSISSIDKQKIEEISNYAIEEIDLDQDFQELCEGAFNTSAVRNKFKSFEELKLLKKDLAKTREAEENAKVEEVEKIDELATRYQQQNYELHKKSLLLLRESLKQEDTAEEILKKVLEFYPDKSLADEALDFLLETTSGDLQKEVLKAKEELNSQFKREITAGRNIKSEAQEFAKTGVGTPTSLRDFYRYVTGTYRNPQTLFNDIFKNYSFNDIKTIIKFLFHALGADLRAKGPSISRPELLKLVDDTKALQAILGVYRFFSSRTNLINSQFAKNDLFLPASLTFEALAKQYLKLLSDRYMSYEKLFQLAKFLGLDDLTAQMIVIAQMRDATRNTSLKLYNSQKHRQEILDATMEALEKLEEEFDEKEEEKEK
jgi:type III secretion protein W